MRRARVEHGVPDVGRLVPGDHDRVAGLTATVLAHDERPDRGERRLDQRAGGHRLRRRVGGAQFGEDRRGGRTGQPQGRPGAGHVDDRDVVAREGRGSRLHGRPTERGHQQDLVRAEEPDRRVSCPILLAEVGGDDATDDRRSPGSRQTGRGRVRTRTAEQPVVERPDLGQSGPGRHQRPIRLVIGAAVAGRPADGVGDPARAQRGMRRGDRAVADDLGGGGVDHVGRHDRTRSPAGS